MWLLEDETFRVLNSARGLNLQPSAQQQAEYESRCLAANSQSSARVLSIDADVAKISVKGILTKEPNFFAMLFGRDNTTYPEIISALSEADRDPRVKTITLDIDSPGGNVAGLFEAIAAIQSVSKPVVAVISDMGASAAFMIASQADRIVASNRAAHIGSVGVVARLFVSDEIVEITSTEAPNKRPDVTTEAGRAVVREELDAFHSLMAEAIAQGRGITVNKVNTTFGKGGILLADEALKRGMIDEIAPPSLRIVNNEAPASSSVGEEISERISMEKVMDAATLKTEHPAAYASVFELGVAKERDRVVAHLTMGEASGDVKTACEAIKEGSEMTSTLQAKYMAAGMNRSDIDARKLDGENADAGDATPIAKAPGEEVARLVEEKMGKSLRA